METDTKYVQEAVYFLDVLGILMDAFRKIESEESLTSISRDKFVDTQKMDCLFQTVLLNNYTD